MLYKADNYPMFSLTIKTKVLWRYHVTVCDYVDMLNAYALSIVHAGLMTMECTIKCLALQITT